MDSCQNYPPEYPKNKDPKRDPYLDNHPYAYVLFGSSPQPCRDPEVDKAACKPNATSEPCLGVWGLGFRGLPRPLDDLFYG